MIVEQCADCSCCALVNSVFQLRITGTNTLTEQKTFGILNLVDLAGTS